jgi:hypothetical protein
LSLHLSVPAVSFFLEDMMGEIHSPALVKLFVGLLTAFPELVAQVEERLAAPFGPVDLRSSSFPFDDTHYYDDEMGRPLERYFFGFSELIRPETLASLKVKTNQIEAVMATADTRALRPVNLDPGYLEQAKVVLASTKNFYHRILLSEGIYGEVTLHFERGAWHSFPWTFPDFRSGRYDGFFTSLRTAYRSQFKGMCRRDTEAAKSSGSIDALGLDEY